MWHFLIRRCSDGEKAYRFAPALLRARLDRNHGKELPFDGGDNDILRLRLRGHFFHSQESRLPVKYNIVLPSHFPLYA